MIPKCPNCRIALELRAISSFDPTGEKLGCIWFCLICGYHSLDRFITVHDGNKHLVKTAICYAEIKHQLYQKRRKDFFK